MPRKDVKNRYIGPQGIVHGTTITVLNASRRLQEKERTAWVLAIGRGADELRGRSEAEGGAVTAEDEAPTDLFLTAFRSMPTANADGPVRSEGTCKTCPMLPPDSN